MRGRENPGTVDLEYREAALDPARQLESIGPYRVHERLGSGGMGEVYKAYDERLERWVAIKRIRPDKETAEEHRERLRREARAAARLNHPSIVQVYDIFEHEEADCIVMELVEGTTLDRLIQHGPLDPFRVADLGRQIANGLAEAHSKGILHRDLKTENVVITAGDQAKILDFGLAKPLIQGDLDSTLTGKGQVVGTSRTMSPEYVSGDEVDHRADLFSLGVLLYEASTGKSPFKAHNTLATLKRVILHRQPPVHEVNPAVPEPLSEIIDRLLEKEPPDRPQSAAEVADALGILIGASSSNVERPGSGSGSFGQWQSAPRNRKHLWLIATAMIIALAFTFWLGRKGGTLQRGSAEEPLLLVLGDFINHTGDDNLDGLNDALRLGLAQSDSITLLSGGELRESLARMKADPEQRIDRDIGIEIAKREGAGGVIVGRVDRIGDDSSPYTLSAEVINPSTGRTAFASTQEAAQKSEVIPALDRIVQSLAGELGDLNRKSYERKPLERVTTGSLEALEAYSIGIQRFDRVQYAQAIPLFEEAVALDPGFAMAHAKLGTAYRNDGHEPEKAVFHLEKALELEDRLTVEESLYVRSWVATLGARPIEALEAWGTMRELLPNRLTGHHNHGLTSWTYFNRFQEAADAIGQAIKIQPHGYAFNHLGYCRLGLNQLDAAKEAFEKAVDLGLERARFSLLQVDLARYDIVSARRVLDTLRTAQLSPSSNPLLWTQELQVDILEGQLEEAKARVQYLLGDPLKGQSIRFEFESRLTLLTLLDALGEDMAFGKELDIAIERSLRIDMSKEFGGETSRPLLLAVLGKVAARHGALESARRLQAALSQFLPAQASGIWKAEENVLTAEIAVAEGRLSEAASDLDTLGERYTSYSATETRAHISTLRGNVEESRRLYRWLVANRGRAFAECVQLCFDRPINISSIPRAIIAAAVVERSAGNETEAKRLLDLLPELWLARAGQE